MALKNDAKTVTIRDVAARAVAVKTVSRFLNQEPYIAPDTRARIAAARRLSCGRSDVLGLLIAEGITAYTADIIQGVLVAATAAGCGIAPTRYRLSSPTLSTVRPSMA